MERKSPHRSPPAPRGRGAASNPANRFTRLSIESEEPAPDRVPTQFLRDASRAVIARNDSPDVGFETSVNPYRGCEHGCVYCFARPFHEFLGFSAGLDFETRILVKEDAPELLRRELAAPSWRPQVIALSGVTDPYQPVERRLGLTRRCLTVLAEFRNPVTIVTKNALVRRDADLLAELARHRAAAVCVSVTTLDPEVARRMEPRTSVPRERLAAIAELTAAGIPCIAMLAPIVPGLTDHEIPRLLAAVQGAGAVAARFLPLRLPGAVAGLFDEWLETHFPERKEKVLHRIREMRGGRLNDPRFGSRMRGDGIFAEQMRALFETSCRRLGLPSRGPELSTAAFRRPPGPQLDLFSGS
jgi:DNA repair photolyase